MKLIYKDDDLHKLGLGAANSTRLRHEAAGIFPKRVRYGGRIGWLASEIEDYVQKLAADREVGR